MFRAFAQIHLGANARLCYNAHQFVRQQYAIQCSTSAYHLCEFIIRLDKMGQLRSQFRPLEQGFAKFLLLNLDWHPAAAQNKRVSVTMRAGARIVTLTLLFWGGEGKAFADSLLEKTPLTPRPKNHYSREALKNRTKLQ